ncbi:hypothetical protein KIPB_002999, partial [Kipferlia bialata]
VEYTYFDTTAEEGTITNSRYVSYMYDTTVVRPRYMASAAVSCTGSIDPDATVSIFMAHCTATGDTFNWEVLTTSSGEIAIDEEMNFDYNGGGGVPDTDHNCMCITMETREVTSADHTYTCTYVASDVALVVEDPADDGTDGTTTKDGAFGRFVIVLLIVAVLAAIVKVFLCGSGAGAETRNGSKLESATGVPGYPTPGRLSTKA